MFNYKLRTLRDRKFVFATVLHGKYQGTRRIAGTVLRVSLAGRGGAKRGGLVCIFAQKFFFSKIDGCSTKSNLTVSSLLGPNRPRKTAKTGFFLNYQRAKSVALGYRLTL